MRGTVVAAAAAVPILMGASWAGAQTQRPRAPPAAPAPPAVSPSQAAAVRPTPDRLSVLQLVWSIMAAVDQANKSGNYSVLRDLGSADFQASNTAASLAVLFTPIREGHLDLLPTLTTMPTYDFAPTMIDPQVLRIRGTFPLRPAGIRFDLLFRWESGWRLHGVAVAQAQ